MKQYEMPQLNVEDVYAEENVAVTMTQSEIVVEDNTMED